jgi:tetratricopeptide (TPR) repeat protein
MTARKRGASPLAAQRGIRTFNAALAASVVVLAAWFTPALACAMDIPVPSLKDAEPQVAEKVELFRKTVEAAPNSAEAWGRYGMILDAHAMNAEAQAAYREANRLAPRDFRWCYYLGLSLLATDPAQARKSLEQATAINAEYPPTYVWLGQVLDMLGESDAAWTAYNKAVTLAPNTPWMRMSLGKAALERGQLDIAKTELHAANEMAPDFGVILSQLAKLHMRLGDEDAASAYGERAGDHMDKVLVLDPIHRRVTDEGVSLAMFAHRAKLLRQAGMLKEAIAEYRRGLEHAPTDLSMVVGLIESLAQAQQHEESLAEANRALEAGVDSVYVHRSRAIALYHLGRHAEAERMARELLEKHPDEVKMYQLLGYIASGRGEIEDSIAHFRQSIEREPNDVEGHLGMIRVLVSSGRFDEADRQLDLIAARKADDPQYARLLGLTRLGQRRFDEAITPLERSLETAPNDGPAIRALASALAGMGRYRDAAERLRQFVTRLPQAVLVANDLAWLLATCPDESARDGEEALKIAQSITEKSEMRVPMLLDTLAAAYAESGRFDDAVRIMDEAIERAKGMAAEALRLASYEERRALYAAGKPYRTETVRVTEPTDP